jgi:hypothetical protein
MGRVNSARKYKSGGLEREGEASRPMADAVNTAIGVLQEKILARDVKGSVTDLVRLLQLRKELEDMRPTSTSARWVDECENISNDE